MGRKASGISSARWSKPWAKSCLVIWKPRINHSRLLVQQQMPPTQRSRKAQCFGGAAPGCCRACRGTARDSGSAWQKRYRGASPFQRGEGQQGLALRPCSCHAVLPALRPPYRTVACQLEHFWCAKLGMHAPGYCRYRGPDAAGLFWLGKPRIALRIIQGIYFENSLSGERQVVTAAVPSPATALARAASWVGKGSTQRATYWGSCMGRAVFIMPPCVV